MGTRSQASGVGLGLAETGHAVAVFPLAALLEQGHALEALQSVSFRAQSAGSAQAAMLCHKYFFLFPPGRPRGAGSCIMGPRGAPAAISAGGLFGCILTLFSKLSLGAEAGGSLHLGAPASVPARSCSPTRSRRHGCRRSQSCRQEQRQDAPGLFRPGCPPLGFGTWFAPRHVPVRGGSARFWTAAALRRCRARQGKAAEHRRTPRRCRVTPFLPLPLSHFPSRPHFTRITNTAV